MKRLAFAAMLGILGLVSPVGAESEPDAGEPGFLVLQKRVQEELHLSEEQKGTLARASEGLRGRALDVAQVKQTLKPEQLARLEEIRLQARGGSALVEADIAGKLGLSTAEKKKLADLWKNEEESLRQVLRVVRFRGPEARARFILEQRQGSGKKMLEHLTEEQLAQWKKLQGKPFEFKAKRS